MYLNQTLPPRFSEDTIKQIALDQYGLQVSVSHFVSDIGQNFYLKDDVGNEYVLKIANPAEREDILEAQNKVLQYLAKQDKNLQVSHVIPSRSGNQIINIKDQNNQAYRIRLLSYIQGEFLATIKTYSFELLYDLGQFLGRLDKTLQDFYHPATLRYWHWDLKHAMDLNKYTHHLKDTAKRRLCEYFLLQFENSVLPKLIDLRCSVIHNDANDYNILVNRKKNDKKNIISIIDFGDLVYTQTICEIAIALAYIMMKNNNPIKVAQSVIQGYHHIFYIEEAELEILFYLITTRLCNSMVMAAYQQDIQIDNPYLAVSQDAAWNLLRKLLSINNEQAHKDFREACGMPTFISPGMDIQEILRERESCLSKALSISYQKPLKIIRGAMQYLFDEKGNTYLDCVNNVCHIGHCHPRVIRTAQKQMAILNTNTRYLHDSVVEYAQRLSNTMPEPLRVCFFVNSGSEANELALRLARTHTGNRDFIVVDHAYHGHTSSLIELSPYKFDGPGGAGMADHVHKVILPDVYRGSYKISDPEAGAKYAEHIQYAITEILDNDKDVAAFFCESLPGCSGQIVLPDKYLQKAYKYIRQADGLCIADEVQVGFGRVGSHFWAFETQNVIPDIVTLGKPIGNGHPLGAVITTPEIAESFDNGMEYFNTFGGNPVSCAVGMTVLDVIQEEDLQKNALLMGNYFIENLNKLKQKHTLIGDVRGLGLFIGIELVLDNEKLTPAAYTTKNIVERMKDEGILLSIDGPFHNVIKIKPPMIFTIEDVDLVVDTFDKILHEPDIIKEASI